MPSSAGGSALIVHESAVPLYQLLIDSLRRAFANGEIQPGDRLPSEVDLCSQYRVSRITVRNAISVLAEEGLVVKKQGKGTFVERPKMERKIIGPISFSAACTYNGMRPGSKTIQRLVRDANALEGRELGLVAGDSVLYIQRLRFADSEPLLIENNCFGFHETRETARGIKIASSHKTIEIVQASRTEADLLDVRIGSPMFYMRGTVFDESGQPVHLTVQHIRGDRFKLTV
jgi:GntR family transcriptional regulator